ncbi:MAG: hypothetical protein MZU95_14225 [Desulfomicrobium escambiense]|nr:hypothetical protein [Desulfomicrobium escambiense]
MNCATLRHSGCSAIIRLLPYPVILNLFRLLASIAWLVLPYHRKVAAIQMRSALGTQDVRLRR